MTIGAVSLGCNKNRVDTEIMLGSLERAGHVLVSDPAQADVIIVNTCGFIGPAKEEAIDTILEMAEHKKRGTAHKLIVTGCLVQRYSKELYDEFPEVDAFLGVSDYDDIASIVQEGERMLHVGDPTREMVLNARVLTTPSYMAYLKIAEGCDNRCAFCAIPSIRGRFRSRPMASLLQEAQGLAARGVKELTLIAQDTTRYGTDLDGRPQLAELVRALDSVDGLVWLRTLYCYPEMIDAPLLDALSACSTFCKYLDIPIQHIDDEVLRAMRRRGGSQSIREAVRLARERGFALRTTLIVGFPGETEPQFEALCAYLEEAQFDHLGVFPYSPEEGTAAATMADQVPDEIKEHRVQTIMRLQKRISLARQQLRVGNTEQVLVTGADAGHYVGRSAWEAPEIDGKIILHTKSPLKIGDFVSAHMIKAGPYDMEAEVDQR